MFKMEFSYLWTILGCLAFLRGLLPLEIAEAINRGLRRLNSHWMPYVVFEIPEFEGASINELYKNVQLHLTAKGLCRSARKTVLCRMKNSANTISTLAGRDFHLKRSKKFAQKILYRNLTISELQHLGTNSIYLPHC